MKIAVLIDAWLPFLGGGQKSVLEITRILQKRHGLEFVIFHSVHPHVFFRFCWVFYIIPQFIFYHFFIKRFDLIDARAFIAGFPAKIISLILKIPIIYTVNGCGKLDQKNKGFFSWLERTLLLKIKYDQQISDSQHFLIYKNININKKILIIPNGVNVNDFERLSIKKDKRFTLIYVGRLAKIKGLNYLVKAIKLLIKGKKDISLKIIGKGEEELNLKRQINSDKLEKWIKFLGELKGRRLIKEYKSSHLFVLPSLAEGQPITLLEAWAAKLPVIVSRVGSLSHYVNYSNGYLVSPADSKQLAETILKAMKNKKLREMGENGFLLVKKKYTWNKTAKSYLSIYKNLLVHLGK